MCYRFLRELSRKLGNVQFYSVNRVLNHHAWALLEDGEVYRAYAWAGETLWNEGFVTAAEKELGLVCFEYGCEANVFACREAVAADAEKAEPVGRTMEPGSGGDSAVELEDPGDRRGGFPGAARIET